MLVSVTTGVFSFTTVNLLPETLHSLIKLKPLCSFSVAKFWQHIQL